MTEATWPFPSNPAKTVARIDRVLDEHVQLTAMVKRHCLAFKTLAAMNASLNQEARDLCAELAHEAETLLMKVKS